MRRLLFESLESRELMAADIRGTVYEDADRSGDRNNGENGISGWTLFLDTNLDGALNPGERTAITNIDGDYRFSSVAPGNHRVLLVMQPQWVATSSVSRDVTVGTNGSVRADYLVFSGGDIEGTVWNDADQDGVRDTFPGTGDFSDLGLEGWTIYLDLNGNQLLDASEPSTLTDSAGKYQFLDLPPDDYDVIEILPSEDWEVSIGFDNKLSATVVAGTQVTLDFANFSLTHGAIQGTIYNDLNFDGVRQIDVETGEFLEPGLEGWTVFVDLNLNSIQDAAEPFTTSDADGRYTFLSLLAGDYRLVEVVPAGWSVSPLHDSQQTVNVDGGAVSIADDFANFTPLNGSIRGTIWNDINRNGIRDINTLTGLFLEPGLAGWTVFIDLNRNRLRDVTEPTAITDGSGQYVLLDLQVGDYEIQEILPAGWEVATTFNDAVTVTVFSGVESIAPDFANYNASVLGPGTISGSVWDDVNSNGVRDVGEPTLSGWTVFLDQNNDGILSPGEPQVTTLSNGLYQFASVPAGTVSIGVVPTVGWRATNPPNNSRTLTLRGGQNLTGLDFGQVLLKDSSIRGVVFNDVNKNGFRDSGERGLSGLTAYLDLNNNNVLDPDEPSTTTSQDLFYTPTMDEAGSFSFTHLASGTYVVRHIVPALLSATPLAELVHTISITTAEDRSGVDVAAVFRPNEIRGVAFDDVNGNHIREIGEPLLTGITLFLDLNRNESLDAGEPTTVTGIDGSYAFTNLSPGKYVIRSILPAERELTYPTTLGGILWPTGVSNPKMGNVSPEDISLSLAQGQRHSQTVSITLPSSGALTNLVDVFLLFDDTGSFVGNSPIVRAAFPAIMSQLQASLVGIDLGFGVGRFEEYGNFGAEYATGRPFVLNQPIVAASTPGYEAAIQAALNRTTPGYGGDQPETVIEALYQVVTGRGFDGNNNGSVLDSGPAGLASTQLSPGTSGDVPSFASFTTNPSNDSVASAAGNIGGAGFRAGSLPIVLLATDTGFAYQPKGESTIAGLNGVALPLSSLTQTSRPTTPFNAGAGIQETITGLNALGALVIGLGTNPLATVDPRQQLESISKLTGAINRTTSSILNGTGDPVDPGDPFYFQIASGFGSSVANGIVSAIQNAVTSVAVDIDVIASDPRVRIVNHSGIRTSVGAGMTASFDVEFIGDGAPRRFDLQFVRAGTNVVLGSIPVVLGTPIPGDGYEYEDLDEGEIEVDDDFGSRHRSSSAASVVASYVYHANSAFSLGGVSAALDQSKVLAKDTGVAKTLTFENLINTTRGINGVVFDLLGLQGSLTQEDFVFQMSPQGAFDQSANPSANWSSAPTPTSVTVEPGDTSRVVITWPDNAIMNRWLRITIKANSNTRLSQPEIYYLGHLQGETTGADSGLFTVLVSDILQIRSALTSLTGADSKFDLDKSGVVLVSDILASRSELTHQLTQITIPGPDSGSSPGEMVGEEGPTLSLPPLSRRTQSDELGLKNSGYAASVDFLMEELFSPTLRRRGKR